MRISVIGLGKLGSCTAACFAYKGYDVIGIDINQKIINLLNEGISPYIEPKLDNFLKESNGRLRCYNNYEHAILETDITFLILPTPSKVDGEFSDEYLKDALKKLSTILKNKHNYHTFVIVSTVSPGTIEYSLIPLIESISKKKLYIDFGIVYNPEFIALGSVIDDFLNPDLVLIGEGNKKDGDLVETIYKRVCNNKPYIARMSIISAEITKISLNSFVTMKISFANTLGNICKKVKGANINDIMKALGNDRRISPYYIKAGPPYGGPCFPRDNKAFLNFAQKYGINAKLAKATDEINNTQIDIIFNEILEKLPQNKTLSIIGLSYKDGTYVTEESASIKLIKKLPLNDIKVYCYDELAKLEIDHPNIYQIKDLYECIDKSSLILLMSKNEEIFNIVKKMNNKTIIDPWMRL